jgi:site-specific recombinase XerD
MDGEAREQRVGDRLKDLTETIKEFERYLRTYPSRQGRLRKESSIEQYVYIVGRLAEYLSKKGMKSFKEATAKDLEEFVLNYENRAPTSKNGQIGWWMRNLVINTLRSFYKWLYRDEVGDGYPPCVARLKELIVRPPLDQRSRVRTPQDLLTDREIAALLRACEDASNPLEVKRNRALIAVLYESGCRVGEIVNLKNRDVVRTDYGFRITVEGKTGRRTIPLVESAPYLLEWAEVHPRGDDPDAPLFPSLDFNHYGKKLNRRSVYDIIRELAKKAGIEKRVYPHLFRHTRATELTNYVSELYLKQILGWSKTSDMPAFYVHLSGRDVEREVLRIHGLVPPEQLKPILSKRKCPICEHENDPHRLYCEACGSPLKTGAVVLKELSEAHEVASKQKEMEERLKKMERAIQSLLKVISLYAGPAMFGLAEGLGLEKEAQELAKKLKVYKPDRLISLDVRPEGPWPED